ncbi:hypothetical protein ACQW02_15010 [Humitalea sp. 24SJ18S-53]|uniref:hypothetical protein n=1 Tax=Humitalea sp. 24SJ18S-53 TaxID=3422307 RepID=UPI003D677C11
MSEFWQVKATVSDAGVTISQADYQAQVAASVRETVRREVTDEFFRRIRNVYAPIALVLALIGGGTIWNYIRTELVRPLADFRQQIDDKVTKLERETGDRIAAGQAAAVARAREVVLEETYRNAAGVAAANEAIQQRVIAAIQDPASPIGGRIASVTDERVTDRLSDRDQRDRVERRLLHAEIADKARPPQRRANAFAQLALLDPNRSERLTALHRVLAADHADDGDRQAMVLVTGLFLSRGDVGDETPIRADTEAARLALARHASASLPLEAAAGILRTLPPDQAADLLRAELYAGGRYAEFALDMLAADGRAAALEALASFAQSGSRSRQERALLALAQQTPTRTGEAAPTAWLRLLSGFAEQRDLGWAVLHEDASTTSLTDLWVLREVLPRSGPTPEMVRQAQARLAAERLTPDQAASRRAPDQAAARAPLDGALGIAPAGPNQAQVRAVMAALLPIDGPQPPWWAAITGRLLQKGTPPREQMLGLVLAADRLVPAGAPPAPELDPLRLVLLRGIVAERDLFAQPLGQRVVSALAHGLTGTEACLDALAEIAKSAVPTGPAAIAAARCGGAEAPPDAAAVAARLADAVEALGRQPGAAVTQDSTAALQAFLTAAAARVEALPVDPNQPWTPAVAALADLPAAAGPARDAAARLYTVLLRRDATAVAAAIERSGGKGLATLASDAAPSPPVAALAEAAATPLPWTRAAFWDAAPPARQRDGALSAVLPEAAPPGAPAWVLLPHAEGETFILRARDSRGLDLLRVSRSQGIVERRRLDTQASTMRLPGAAGPWLLSVRGDKQDLDTTRLEVVHTPAFVDGPTGRGDPVALGQALSMALEANEVRYVQVDLAPRTRYRVETMDLAAGVDTVVTLHAPNGVAGPNNDDGGVGLASRMAFSALNPDGAGGPHVLALSNIGTAGEFLFSVTAVGIASPAPPTVAGPTGRGQPITIGTTYTLAQGRAAEAFVQLDLAAGQRIVARTRELSAGVDTVLELFGPDGERLGSDDDGGGGLASMLSVTATSAGPHVLKVSNIGGAGDFDLAVEAQ